MLDMGTPRLLPGTSRLLPRTCSAEAYQLFDDTMQKDQYSYTHTHTHIYIYVCIYIYIYIFIHIYIYIYIYIYIHIYWCRIWDHSDYCPAFCRSAPIIWWRHAKEGSICIHTRKQTHTHIYIYIYIYIDTYILMYIHMLTHIDLGYGINDITTRNAFCRSEPIIWWRDAKGAICIHTRKQTHTHIYVRIYIDTYILMCIYMLTHIDIGYGTNHVTTRNAFCRSAPIIWWCDAKRSVVAQHTTFAGVCVWERESVCVCVCVCVCVW